MKLALFSQNIDDNHLEALKTFFDKPFHQAKFLYISTAGNYKPYKTEWMIKAEKNWQNIFQDYHEFDLEKAFKVDNNFNFKKFLSSFDFIYVAGGNIFILSYWMNKTGSDLIIKDLIVQNKVVYGGSSAGSIYVSQNLNEYNEVDNPEIAIKPVYDGMGIVDFYLIPHWENNELQKELVKIKEKFEKKNLKVYTLTDEQCMFINNTKIEII